MPIPKKVKNGKLMKNGKGKYSLILNIGEGEIEYKDITKIFMNENSRALTRLISLSLRHGVRPVFISDQLKKSNEGIVEFSSVVRRVLNKYMKSLDYTYINNKNDDKCEFCGSSNWSFTGGCKVCADCGKGSKCD